MEFAGGRTGGRVSQEYPSAFMERVEVAPGVESVRFERPNGYTFEPGQHLSLELQTRDGRLRKPFTHSNAPDDGPIEVTTRLSGSAYKAALGSLAPGDVVTIRGPLGQRALPDGTRRAVFLVGGVGITPAMSVLRDARIRGTGLEAVVFHGNRDGSEVPFGDELERMAERRVMRLITVLENPGEGWRGECGLIDAAMIRRHIEPLAGWRYVIAGPPAMVEAMNGVIAELGVPEEVVSATRFSGYR